MDDILQFLVIAGAIAFGIFRQFKKTEANKSEKRIPTPTPEFEYETYEPENKPEFEPVILPKKTSVQDIPKKKTASAYQPVLPLTEEGTRATAHALSSSSLDDETSPNENEYAIHSREEAERAIIWSEILQRKY